jgi:hypothetical protein
MSTMYTLKPGEAMNLGRGIGTSFKDLILRTFGLHTTLSGEIGKISIKPLLDKPTGVFSRVSDTYFMNQHFTPKVSLDEGIRRSLEFARARLDTPAIAV